MRRRSFPYSLKLIIFFILASATTVSAVPAAASADDKTAQIDKLFAAWDTTTTPGVALAVIRDGAIIYKRGYGMARIEDGIVNTPSKIFDIGSVSKQFTATCVALLVKDGKIKIDDDIRKYFPEMNSYEKPITVRHLLHHTSGLRDYNTLLEFAGFRPESDCPTVEESREIIFRQKRLNHLPGQAFSYTNSGYFLLGQIVEKVSGKSLNAFAQERIFKPLGMSHTLYQEDHTQLIPNRSVGYDPIEGGGFKIDMSNWDETGDGNVYTSVEDLFLWDQAFYSNALGKDVMDMIQTPGTLDNGTKIDYAWGLRVATYRGLKTVEHGGAWAGFRAEILRFPDQKLSVIALSNRSDFDGSPATKIAEIYLGDRMEPARAAAPPAAKPTPAPKTPPAILSEAQLREFAGEYVCEELLDARYRVVIADGKMAIRTRNLSALALDPAGTDRFLPPSSEWGRITFEFIRGVGKAVTGFTVNAGRMRGVAFVKTK
jgi:CubicO group peptidase (beta-lactamase class C family)